MQTISRHHLTAGTATPVQRGHYWQASEHGVDVYLHVATADEARELAASFPKSLRLRGTSLSYWNAGEDKGSQCGLVHLQVRLTATATTGDANEAGVKRLRSFFRHAAKRGLTIPYVDNSYTNSLAADKAAELAGLA